MTTTQPINQALAAAIAARASGQGRSQRELSEMTGIPLVTLSRKLRCLSPLSIPEVANLAEALGTSVLDLVLEAERTASPTAA